MEHPLDRNKFKELIMGLKTIYSSDWFIPNEEALNIWYRCLMDLPYSALANGVGKWIRTSSKEPTVADLRKAAMEFMPNQDPDLNMNEQEAWSIVDKAIKRSGWHAEEEFNKLSPLLQKAVASASNLHAWSQSDESNLQNVAMSQFLRNFRVEQKRAKEEAILPPALQKQLKIAMDTAKVKKIETRKLEPEEEWAKQAFTRDSENHEEGKPMPESAKKRLAEIEKKWKAG